VTIYYDIDSLACDYLIQHTNSCRTLPLSGVHLIFTTFRRGRGDDPTALDLSEGASLDNRTPKEVLNGIYIPLTSSIICGSDEWKKVPFMTEAA
jgi:hypothetical protein